jgi:hypothetical protein
MTDGTTRSMMAASGRILQMTSQLGPPTSDTCPQHIHGQRRVDQAPDRLARLVNAGLQALKLVKDITSVLFPV